MRVIKYEICDEYYDAGKVVTLECYTDDGYIRALAGLAGNDSVCNIRVYVVEKAFDISRHELLNKVELAKQVFDETDTLREALREKALWGIRKLALQRMGY